MNSSSETANEEEEGDGKEKREILLPLGEEGGESYVLDCWKVKEGALVRKGETVALACKKSDKKQQEKSSSGSAPPAAAAATKHKRPSRRRKRPVAAAAVVAPAPAPAPPVSNNNKAADLQCLKFPPKEISTTGSKATDTTSGATAAEVDSKDSSSGTTGGSTVKPQHHKSLPILAPMTGFVRITNQDSNKSDDDNNNKPTNVIGFIEPCSHPAVVDGLCVACGVKISTTNKSSPVTGVQYNDSNRSSQNTDTVAAATQRGMSQVTVEGGLTVRVSEKEGMEMAKQNAQRLRDLKKLSLILDLDATLVHATDDSRAQEHLDKREDVRSILLPASEDPNAPKHFVRQHYIKLRPNVKQFLEGVRYGYELGVYTAGTRQYAEQIAIILCRHLVGAKRDQIQLDQLRYEVDQAERKLQAKSSSSQATTAVNSSGSTTKAKAIASKENGADEAAQEKNDKSSTTAETKSDSGVDVAVSEGVQEENNNDNKNDEDTKPPAQKKRKVVSFAAEPPSTKEENMKQATENLEELRRQLQEAEEKEKEALDLRRRLFGSRITSRCDVGDLGRSVKSLTRIFPGGGTMAAVVDDREDVWANANNNAVTNNSRPGEPPDNLLLVEAYHWQPFAGFADINNAAGLRLSRGGKSEEDEDESDRQLLWTMSTLRRLHARYYSDENSGDNQKTVPELLNIMRKEILAGKTVVLSGLVPLHQQNRDDDDNNARKKRPDAIRYIESMGAKILPSVQPGTSYVVAARDGTDKILTARRTPGCFVVKRSWMMECYWSLTRRDPKLHLLEPAGRDHSPPVRSRSPLPPLTSPIATSAAQMKASGLYDGDTSGDDDEDDDDDDDFAAELENELL